jgi:hypothetical protein
MAIPRVVAPVVRMIPRIGILAPAVTWLIGTLVGLVFSALTLYVPIVAVREGGGLSAIGRGVGDGWRLFGTTYLVLATFSALPLVITAFIQTSGSTLVARLRPEVMPWMLLTYALLMSVANYLVYSAGARMHEAAVKEEE